MTAEQPSVQALVEQVRVGITYQRQTRHAQKVEAGLAALDSLTAALERAEFNYNELADVRQRESLDYIELQKHLERAERERDAYKKAASPDELVSLLALNRADKRAEAAEARAQKAEAENREWEVLVRASHNERDRLLRADAVVEAARHWNEAWFASDTQAAEKALTRLSMLLTAYDEPPTEGWKPPPEC